MSASSITSVSKSIRTSAGQSNKAENANASIEPAKASAQSQPTATGQATRGALTSADQAKLNTARRNEHNPYTPRKSIGDASQRMRAGTNPRDFAEGTSTMRGSMKPLGDVLHSSWVVLQHQKGTKLDAAAVPASKKRLSGESTHEYLTRHEVQQSLRAAQQSAADNGGRRMVMLPRPGPEPCASGARRFQFERLGRRPQHVAGFAGTPEVGAFPGPGTAASAAHIEVARMTNGRPSPNKVHQAAQGLGISRTVANIRPRHLQRTVQRNADREARGRKISERRECCACIHRLAQRAKRHSHFVKSLLRKRERRPVQQASLRRRSRSQLGRR